MTDRKRILFLTGTRADFGKLKPLIRQTDDAPQFEARIFATGMHMLSRYGSTINEIRKAGFQNIFTFINQDASYNKRMDLVLATTIEGLGHYLHEFPADLLVVHGDRVETMAGASVGALSNTLVAHIEGGELSGTVDELIRHATTKLSHIHFVANEEAKRRVIQLGELEDSVYVIGSPDIDIMLSNSLPTFEEARRRYNIPYSEYGLFCYHPVTTELDKLSSNIEACKAAMIASGMNWVVIYPNNDHGSDVILDSISTMSTLPGFKVCPSFRFEYYLVLLRNAVCIAGNSSAGIREAPVYGIPTVNIGSRQKNRFRSESIVDVDERKDDLVAAFQSLPRSVVPSYHFGTGKSAELFLESLRSSALWRTSRQKQFRDLV